ncbi:putative acetylornithine deacetylase [Thozetella sp. PMI_491]|nr:putative acetylornithine deacetylase [Thozetella sp. PMI_491]
MDPKTLLLKALDADKQSQIDLLQAFVRAACPNPPGDTTIAATVLTDYLTSKGIPYEIIEPQPGQPNVVSEFQGGKGSGPRVVMNGHIDVFPVGDGAGWSRDPWSGEIVGDQIHGRGVVDMKSGTASLVVAYAYLYERRDLLSGSVALCAVSDEETGGKWGTKYLIQQDRARWGGDLMMNTEPGGCGTIRFAEKGTLRMTVTVKTRDAHGAYTNLSKGAIRTASAFITDVVRDVEAIPVDLPAEMAAHLAKPEVRRVIDETMGAGTADIIDRPTVNIGTIKGGLKVNMIPSTCVFEADIRLPVGLTKEQVLAVMEPIATSYKDQGATIELEVQQAASNPYSFSSISHSIVSLLVENAKDLAPDAKQPIPIPSMGATDCKHYRYAGVPAYTYGCSPYKMASVDEYASIKEFLHVTKVQAAATWDFLKG